MQALSEIPIVLTASIQPSVVGSVINPEVRLNEYLRAVEFYREHTSAIIFLENSSYPGGEWTERLAGEGVRIIRMPESSQPDRGKGFQEFEMLDRWMAAESSPPDRWLKITGRYIIKNVGAILEECVTERSAAILIDQSLRTAIARTHVFCVQTSFYRETMAGLFQQCDDNTGEWIEKVVFRRLMAKRSSCRFFRHRPDVRGASGSTGAAYPSGVLGHNFKQLLRHGNRIFDRHHLWFSR
jgi:hypothetical protein